MNKSHQLKLAPPPRFFIYPLIMSLLLLTSCVSPIAPQPRPLVINDLAKLHAIESKRLERIMHSLHYKVYAQQRNRLEIDESRAHYALRLAEGLEKMSGEIIELSVEPGELKLNAKQLMLFKKYAQQLAEHGIEIKQLLNIRRMEALDPTVNALLETCDACHKHFHSMR